MILNKSDRGLSWKIDNCMHSLFYGDCISCVSKQLKEVNGKIEELENSLYLINFKFTIELTINAKQNIEIQKLIDDIR